MIRRAIVIALVAVAATANAQPVTEPPTEDQVPSPVPIDEPPPPPTREVPTTMPGPPRAEAPPAPRTAELAPSCVAGGRWYVETSVFVGSVRYRYESTDSTMYPGPQGPESQTRFAPSAANGFLYRGCAGADSPGMHVRIGAFFEVRDSLPLGAEAQIDWPRGGYRLGGRLGVSTVIKNYGYSPELTVGFRARRGILLFGVDGVYANYRTPYGGGSGSSIGVLAGVGIQARPDAD